MKIWFAIGIMLIGCRIHLYGQELPAADKPTDIYKIADHVIIGTSHERTLLESPYATHLLSSDERTLRLQPKSLADGLKEIPGVLLQKTGHGMTSPFIRGVSGQRVVLIADETRINNSYLREGPNEYWSLVDTYYYDTVEVLMGPASVLYGSDAIGGVVKAYSAPMIRGVPDEGLRFQDGTLLFRYSSAERSASEHVKSQLSISDQWSLSLGLTRQDFGNLRTGNDDEEEKNEKTDFDKWGGNLRLRYWFDEDVAMVFGYDQVEQDDIDRVHSTIYRENFHGTNAKGGATDRQHTFAHDRRTGFVRWEKRHGSGWIEELDAGLSYTYFLENFRRTRGNGVRELRDTQYDTLGATLRLQTPSPAGTWIYGLDYYRDFVETSGRDINAIGVVTRRIQGLVADDANYDLAGAYVQNEFPLTERLELIGGVRYTYARMDARKVDLIGARGRVNGNWDAVTGSMRLLNRVLDADRLNLFAGISQGFRAPNLSDSTRLGEFGGGTEQPTAGLDPELFTTYEVGAKSGADWGSMGIAYYYTDIEDRIGRLTTPVTKRNLDDGYIHGIESNLQLTLTSDLYAFGSIAWQEGYEDAHRNLNLALPIEERRMSRMMPLTAQTGIGWRPDRQGFWLEFYIDAAEEQNKIADSEKTDNRFPPGGTPGYAVYNLRGGFEIWKQVDLAVALENIGDKAYRIHGSGINEPGRNLVVTLRTAF